MFKVMVTIAVVNDMGDVVDHRGYVKSTKREFYALETKQQVRSFDHIEAAHSSMNQLFRIVNEIKELK